MTLSWVPTILFDSHAVQKHTCAYLELESVMNFCELGVDLSMLKGWKEKHTQAT